MLTQWGLNLDRQQLLITEGEGVGKILLREAYGSKTYLARLSFDERSTYGQVDAQWMRASEIDRANKRNADRIYEISDLKAGYYEASSSWRAGKSERVCFLILDDGSLWCDDSGNWALDARETRQKIREGRVL
jgi:hypothetical protein